MTGNARACYEQKLPILESPRLRLRALLDEDVPALFRIFSDPAVTRYWSSPPMRREADARTLLEEIREEYQRGELLEWGLEHRDQPGVIGTCALSALDLDNRRAEIGFALARAAWGQGLMGEILPVLVEHAFGAMGLHRLEADVDPRNEGSIRALQRLGFIVEGRLRERWQVTGEVQDTLMLGLLAPEWRARAPSDGG
ncbi:MAG: GNAT family protein [Pseudomonadales bacterium]|nr:GNAT family protein [Pseudomonadales bacterium]